jgi:phospholipid-translocating ATPase
MRIGIETVSNENIYMEEGTDIVGYDIYGKDVSIARKMESNGEVGIIFEKSK